MLIQRPLLPWPQPWQPSTNSAVVAAYNEGRPAAPGDPPAVERRERCKRVGRGGAMRVHMVSVSAHGSHGRTEAVPVGHGTDPRDDAQAWGTAQEPAALFALLHHFRESHLLECGLCPILPASLPAGWNVAGPECPPLGASPDGILQLPVDPGGGLEARLAAALPDVWEACRARGDDAVTAVVEIKSVSPFRELQRTRTPKYRLIDAQPREAVRVLDVPQLQLHLLATGAPFALYLSHSASNGAAAYVMRSDGAYQRRMLELAASFVADYVKAGRPPPPDFNHGREGFQAFLAKTRELARSAKLLAVTNPVVMRGCDTPPFV